MSGVKAETPVVQRALQLLHARYPGSVWWRQNSGAVKVRRGYMHLAPAGSSDVIGVQRFGMSAFCEVKRRKKRLTEEQWLFLSTMQGRGALVLVFVEDTLYHLRDLPEDNMPGEMKRSAA